MHEFLVTLAFSSSRHDGTHRQTPENARVPRTVELERYGVPVLVGRSEPTSIDLTDQCFDRFGGLGWQLFLGFGADDHFFCDAGRLGSLQGGKVRAPPCGI